MILLIYNILANRRTVDVWTKKILKFWVKRSKTGFNVVVISRILETIIIYDE